jgi:hypothetical protein
MLLRALFAASLMAGFNSALAQGPPPVPALPDTVRQTSYSISSSTCACAVGFQLYGDGTDVDNWLHVYINGQAKLSTDPSAGWLLSSPTGPLNTIPRPITDAILTFNSVQTGTITITGAQRPRRLQTFAENQGVTARQLNQVFNTVFAELRENWDKAGSGGAVLPSIIVSVRSTSASTTMVPGVDYFLCVDPTPGIITVTLNNAPAVGQTYLIKDCTGQSGVHAITVVPAAGNIDGNANAIIGIPYQSIAVTYTGAQWSIN